MTCEMPAAASSAPIRANGDAAASVAQLGDPPDLNLGAEQRAVPALQTQVSGGSRSGVPSVTS